MVKLNDVVDAGSVRPGDPVEVLNEEVFVLSGGPVVVDSKRSSNVGRSRSR